MDIQKYILSGIIEACVLGMASTQDMRELESLSTKYPEIKEAVEACRATLGDLANLQSIPAPVFLKDKIWDALEKEVPVTPTEPQNKNIAFKQANKNKRPLNYLVAASLALLTCSILFNFFFWNKSQSFESRIAGLEKDQQKTVALNQDYETKIKQYQINLQLLLNPSVKSVSLNGVGIHSQNDALVLWDSKSKDVYLLLRNLPKPPSGKQYQLWAIVDGKPVDAGVYPLLVKDSIQKMKRILKTQMFAVTLEQEDGAASPTMSEMYVAGKI